MLGSVIFLVDVGVLIWNVAVLRSRSYSREKPGFLLVFFSVFAIFLVLAFAGVQPIAAYKDTVTSTLKLTTQSVLANLPKSPPSDKSVTTPTQVTQESKPSIPTIKSTTGLVGKWRDTKTNSTIEFFKDGRLVSDDGQYMISGTYELIGNEYVKVALEGFAGAWVVMSADTWKYQVSGDTLYMVGGGETSTLRRVR
jgi:hypothetical protein